jgi:magnesium chelatase family protein
MASPSWRPSTSRQTTGPPDKVFLAGLATLDRIDIHIEVPAVAFRELAATTPGTSSAAMREQVVAARGLQTRRFASSSTRQNGHMSHRQIRSFCQLDEAGSNLLRATMTELGLSARAHDKILRLSRTIADLDAADGISPAHISEAINYRMLDRNLWS